MYCEMAARSKVLNTVVDTVVQNTVETVEVVKPVVVPRQAGRWGRIRDFLLVVYRAQGARSSGLGFGVGAVTAKSCLRHESRSTGILILVKVAVMLRFTRWSSARSPLCRRTPSVLSSFYAEATTM